MFSSYLQQNILILLKQNLKNRKTKMEAIGVVDFLELINENSDNSKCKSQERPP